MPKRMPPDPDLVALLQGIGEQQKAVLTPHEMVEHLERAGYEIVKKDPLREYKPVVIKDTWQTHANGAKTLVLGVVSDTHFGSQKQQLSFLNVFYDRCQTLGIKTVVHAGDLVDGAGTVYRGQEYDLFIHGYDRHRDYAVANYPRRKGITTYFISGNHDESFRKRGGADICAAIAERRDDMVYLGPLSAKVALGATDGVHIRLTHGGIKGQAYALSYRLQRLIENFTPESKPDVFLLGNYHSFCNVPMVRNVFGYMMGCFQAQTDHERGLGLFPHIGGLVLTIIHKPIKDREHYLSYTAEIIPCYVPKERDW